MIDFSDSRYQQSLALILELGCTCAITNNSREQAVALVAAHKAARPAGRGHVIGNALIALCCDANPEEAVSIMRNSGIDYRDADEDPSVVSMWAFILMRAEYKSEAQTVAQYLLEHSGDAGTSRMARGILDELTSVR